MSQDLSHEARALLALAKQAGSPDDADVARARAIVMGKVGVGIAAGAATVKTASSAAAATKALAWSSLSLTTKLVFVTALVGGGVTGGYAYLAHRDDVAAQQSRVAVAPIARAGTATSRAGMDRPGGDEAIAITGRPDDAANKASADGPPQQTPASSVTAARRVRPSPSTSTSEAALDRPPPSTSTATSLPRASAATTSEEPPRGPATEPVLADDIRHLREAQRALVQGDAVRARAEAGLVRKDGPFAEEAEGMEIVAACSGADPAEGRRKAAEFARRRPDSSLLARIQSACSR